MIYELSRGDITKIEQVKQMKKSDCRIFMLIREKKNFIEYYPNKDSEIWRR